MQPDVLSKVSEQFWLNLAQDWPPRTGDTAVMPRAWWWQTSDNYLVGMEESITYIRDVLARDRFQVCACGCSYFGGR